MKNILFLFLLASLTIAMLLPFETKQVQSSDRNIFQDSSSTEVLDSKTPPIEDTLSIYNFSLNFDPTSSSVGGILKFNFFNDKNVSLSQLYFHLWPEASLLGYPAALEIREITDRNANSLAYWTLDKTNLVVDLAEAIAPGSSTLIFIEFATFLPYSEQGGRFAWSNSTSTIYNFGNWFPQLSVYENGQWDISPYVYGGEAFYSDVALFDVALTTPDSLIAAASGELVHNVSSGNSMWDWRWKTGPVRDFFFSLSPDFQVATKQYQNTTIFSYFQPMHEKYGKLVLDIVAEDLYIFGNLFEPYPYSTISVVETPAWFGGMEYPNIVLIAEGYYESDYGGEDGLRDVVSHEIAHNWFAYLVGSDSYAEPWLDEAFATYCGSYLYFEFSGRQAIAAANLQKYQELVIDTIQAGFDYKINQSMGFWDSDWASKAALSFGYGIFVYCKGFCVVHMLRQVVGNETFFKGLQAYFDEWAYENAHITDFIAIMEATAGYSLTWFFDEWLDGIGIPEFSLSKPQAVIYPNRTILTITVQQIQLTPFIMPLAVEVIIDSGNSSIERVIWMNESSESITIEILGDGIPTLVIINAQDSILQSGSHLKSVPRIEYIQSETTTSSNASAFDFGTLAFLSIIAFPVYIHFRRKKPFEKRFHN
ncbi:MAG: M1 family aminopeptidase [Candidatus Thorarchaeota archaeon]